MADEIAQVCQVEIEGTTMVLKGSVKAIAWLAQAIKSLLHDVSEHMTARGGEKHNMNDIWKLSKDGPPQVILVDEKKLDAVLSAAAKAGLRWTRVADFDSTDGKAPICLPPQDMALFSAIVQSSLQKDISESQKILDGYNEEISELKEQLLHADAGKRNDIRVRVENLEQARDELLDILSDKKTVAENGGAMSFQDYLATSVGTEFEKDPEKAMAEYAKGVDMGPALEARECMQPIRSKALMPDSEIRFYVPDMGVTITRKFEVENDMVYSVYSFKTDSGEIHEFSDKGITRAEWNNRILPGMLDKAGIQENTLCRAFDSEEKMQAFETYHNNTPLKSEEKFEENRTLGFSTAEAEQNIRYALEDKMKGEASAKVDENEVHISAPAEHLIQRDGKVSMQVGDKLYQFENVIPKAKDDGVYTLAIKKDSLVTVKEKDGSEKQISALRAQKDISTAQHMEKRAPMLEAAQTMALSMRK